VGDHALLWRELTRGGPQPAIGDADEAMARLWPLMVGVALGAALAALVRLAGPKSLADLAPSFAADVNELDRGLLTPAVRVAGLLLAAAWCLAAAFRAADSVSREREQGTLVGLLTLPASRAAVLGAKWLGSVLRYRAAGYGLAVVLTLGLLTGALHPLSAALLAASYAACVAFVASAAVWLSMACRNTHWAQVTMALVLLLMFIGAWTLVGNYAGPYGARVFPGRLDELLHYGGSPLAAWWYLAFSWGEFGEALQKGDPALRLRVQAGLGSLAAFTLLAGLLWLAARVRINREPYR
jgi:hypothetical protein